MGIELTIKPTLACNMRCKHCFNGSNLESCKMLDIDTVKRFVKVAASDYKNIKVTFHGGEPTLAGLDFFKEFFEYEQELTIREGVTFNNLFTTNGVLLTEPLINLLKENNTLINVSFDGPYNSILRERSDLVMQNISNLKSKKVRFRIYCIICAKSVEHFDEIYGWFKEKEWDFKVIPIEPHGNARVNSDLLLQPETYINNLILTYKHWLKDKACKIKVYTFQEFAALKRNVQFKDYWFGRKVALNPDGKIYPFGRPNDIHFCLKSPYEISSLKECFLSEAYTRLLTFLKSERNRICLQCNSFHICRGVALNMAYMYGAKKDMIEYSCKLANLTFYNILKVNDEITHDFKNGVNQQYYNDWIIKEYSK